ncbi:hypothetical protein JMJ35_010533 [Cladonia borealis]|uniref:Uncharacterized protein n=1 Tax=Cladonia borealis TaxID=184061 RepID=A0AA39V5X7_9LECA|nr:hypothetical protein JMJ35_010533 [Cladonia borealis]
MWSLLCPIFLLFATPAVLANIICNGVIYGHPNHGDCLRAISTIPYSDDYARFFIENPLLVTPLNVNWPVFVDPRPRMAQTPSIQLPKFWAYGSCNIALTTYFVHPTTPLTSWSIVYLTGVQALNICQESSQGGWATVGGLGGVPVLSLFFWANGAAFQDIVNIYMSAGFPKAIDPSMSLALVNGSAGPDNSSSNASYSAYPPNPDGLNNTLIRLSDAAAPVDSS